MLDADALYPPAGGGQSDRERLQNRAQIQALHAIFTVPLIMGLVEPVASAWKIDRKKRTVYGAVPTMAD
jgi:hypothetical protein